MGTGFKEKLKVSIKKCGGRVIFGLLSVLPLKDTAVFCNFNGKCYDDNPRYISEELHRRNPEIHQIWIEHKGYHISVPDYVEVVQWPSFQMFRALATAKLWVDSHSKPLYVWKRKKQYFLETWHGGLGFKKIEGDAADSLDYEYLETSRHNVSMADVFASNSTWLNDIYRRAFGYHGKILQYGYPKNDLFFQNDHADVIADVRSRLGLTDDEKICLYAPTFRENVPPEQWLDLDFRRLAKHLNASGEKWVLLVKLHPKMTDYPLDIDRKDGIINASGYPNTQELILASDMLITDYSSCVFDFCLMRRPAFVYASDYASYESGDRGLYFRLDELPFPYASTTDGLIENIKSFDNTVYLNNLERFFIQVGLTENGTAAQQLVSYLTDHISFSRRK